MGFVMSTMPRGMLTIAMIFTFLTNLNGMEYRVTTFFENDNSNVTINSRGISNNTKISTKYISLPHKGGLDEVYAKLYIEENMERNTAANIYTSFTSKKTSNIIQEFLYSRKSRTHQIRLDGCIRTQDDVILQKLKCQKFRQEYIDLIKSLIKNLYLYPIAIITDHDECSNSFSKKLMQELIKMGTGPDKTAFYNYKIEKTSEIKLDLPKILYDIKIKSVTLIIVLSDDIMSELIFKFAAALSLLSFNEVWLTIDFKLELDNSRAPSQFLTITKEKSVERPSSLASNKELIGAMNLMVLSKDARRESNGSGTFANLWRNESLNQMEAASCHTQYSSAVTSLVLLRKSKYNWITLYKWNFQNNLVMVSSDSEFARFSRSKLQGITLRVVTAFEPPFVFPSNQYYNKDATKKCQRGILCRVPEETDLETKWKETCCIGFIMDMLERLKNDLWFNTDLYIVEDGYYGALSNGSWNGMIGDVANGKADLAVAALTATNHRSTVVDFSEPFLEVNLAILLKSKQPEKIKFLNFAFIKYLSDDLLWAILGVFIGGMILVYVLENQSVGTKNSHNFPLKECFTYFSGLTFQRDLGGRNPIKMATRITAITFAFAMVVIMTTYTAILTAVKVKQEVRDPFLGMKDPKMTHPTSDFKYGCIQSSSTSAFFQHSENLVYRNMYLFMKAYNPKSTEKGVEDLQNGRLQAFITEYPMAQFYVSKQRDCGLAVVQTQTGKSSWAIASKNGWSWNYLISQKVLQYKENGILADMNKKWTKTSCTNAGNNTSTLQSFPIEYFGGLIIILIGFFGFSLILLLVESVLKKYRCRVTDPVKRSIGTFSKKRSSRETSITITSFKRKSEL